MSDEKLFLESLINTMGNPTRKWSTTGKVNEASVEDVEVGNGRRYMGETPQPAQNPAQTAQNPAQAQGFEQMLFTLFRDLSQIKQNNIKLHGDADAIVQGTKTQPNNPIGPYIRRMARDIRETCAQIDGLIAQVSNNLTQFERYV